MARKAKESAQQKISSLRNNSRRSAAESKSSTTATTTTAILKKNANTSDENRIPLQTQSQSTINSLKNCSVQLMRIPDDTIELQPKEPATFVKEPDAPKSAGQNVYDYSFDLDATPLENSEPMQELFEKLAAENRIEIKKYKPKAVRQVKKKADDADKPKVAQKRRRDKPKTTAEPPLKKPNPTVVKNQAIQAKPVQIDSNSNKILPNAADKMDSNGNMPSPIARITQSSNNLRTNQIRNVQQRLRESLNMKPTLGSSTPLNPAKTLGTRMRNNENNTSQNLSWLGVSTVGNRSPMGNKSTPITRPSTSSAITEVNRDTNQENDENTNHSVFAVDDFDAMDFIDPEPIPSTSAAAMGKPMAVNSSLSASNRENQSAALNDSSSFNIFSPTKRRVYGRSPLKNITSEINNTGNSTFESLKSLPSFAPSFESASRDSRNASTNRSGSILPEANYLSVRRTGTDFDRRRTSVAAQNIDKCFGFEDDDDDNDVGGNETTTKARVETSALNRARADLKRFLHGSNTRNETLAKKPTTKEDIQNKPNLFKSPTKEKSANAFDESDKNKQKDIRSAFEIKTAKNVDSAGASTKRVVLFEEDVIVQDRRKSYSRPVRQTRKRRISIESEEEDERDDIDKESDEENEAQNENGGKKVRSKRRKKTGHMNPKETKELEEFVQQTNAHFDEIDSFTMILE